MNQRSETLELRIRIVDADAIAKMAKVCGIGFQTYVREILEVFVAEKGGRLDKEGRCRICPLQGAWQQKVDSRNRYFRRKREPAKLSILFADSDRPADVRDGLDKSTRGPVYSGRTGEDKAL